MMGFHGAFLGWMGGRAVVIQYLAQSGLNVVHGFEHDGTGTHFLVSHLRHIAHGIGAVQRIGHVQVVLQ